MNKRNRKTWKGLLLFWLPLAFAIIFLAVSYKYRSKLYVAKHVFVIAYTHTLSAVWYPLESFRDSITFIIDINHTLLNNTSSEKKELLENFKMQLHQLKFENQQLRKQLHYRPSENTAFYLARVIGVLQSPFLSQIFINIGEKQHINVNDAILFQGYFIGRVIKVLPNYSIVMLLNDPNSQIPVTIVETLENAIVEGNNSPFLRLFPFKGFQEDFLFGEHVVTSGIKGLLPPGLLIGKITKENNNSHVYTVTPYVSLATLHFVTVIKKP